MKRVLTLVGVVLLGGCAIAPVVPIAHPRAVWQAHRARVEQLSVFHLRALAGVRTGTHGGSLMLHWVTRPGRVQIRGYGPFGTLIFRLRIMVNGAHLTTRQGHYAAANADALLARLTGWPLPVGGLRYWIMGIPAPGVVSVLTLNKQGLLGSLWQNGWVVRYQRYRRTHAGRLPWRLTLVHRADGTTPAFRIRIRVEQWQIA